MAHSPLSKCLFPPRTKQEEENNKKIYQYYSDQLSNLPVLDGCCSSKLCNYNGWFAPMPLLIGTMVAQQHFHAKPSDVILATVPKSGTTWLKALLFATASRSSTHYDPHHLLTTLSSHNCVPFLENDIYANDQVPNLELLPSPRLFATHIPFHSLPNSVFQSGCKIVYLCRNPKDNFVSLWHFANKINLKKGVETISLEEGLDRFSEGLTVAGPFWDHVLGYWKASLGRPEQLLFLKFEEFMEDPINELKRMAEFIGCPFTIDEDRDGVVEGIVNLCGFENLSNLVVNRIGTTGVTGVDNSMFYRLGVVGDWVNYLAPEMARRLDKITKDKFCDSGLTF